MELFHNPHRLHDFPDPALADIPAPSVDAAAPLALLKRCPHAGITPLVDAVDLAQPLGVGALHIKDERSRMGLGSFKALGAAYVMACDHVAGSAKGATYVTASAGNHGLSVAAGAQAFGCDAVIFLAQTVPETFAQRLRDMGAKVIRHGAEYEASMAGAQAYAQAENARLLSDSSWPGYTQRPHRLMEGYLALMAETFDQIPAPPTHIFLQAGVGGLAGAAAALARHEWGDSPVITVVEPEAAPALIASVKAGRAVTTQGPVSAMGRLDCKEPSLIALKGLARDADHFMTLTEAEGQAGADFAARHNMPSTPSGAAGLSGLIAAREELHIDGASRVLVILSEGPDT